MVGDAGGHRAVMFALQAVPLRAADSAAAEAAWSEPQALFFWSLLFVNLFVFYYALFLEYLCLNVGMAAFFPTDAHGALLALGVDLAPDFDLDFLDSDLLQ
ncbi:dexamethasone-induced protein [Petromyzon marinus]|uniref:dexamethasone-induced protein n=1 Tax=Petromyzon marinus TaxID=7757 RepID=UPI003F6FC4F5